MKMCLLEETFPIADIPEGTTDEVEIFEQMSVPFIAPELRWNDTLFSISNESLIKEEDIKGVIHCHTTYSDGIHTVKEMCAYASTLGYKYIGFTDHSQSAVYASGLIIERVIQQQREIDLVQKDFPE